MATATSTTSTTKPAESDLDRLNRLDRQLDEVKARTSDPHFLATTLLFELQKRHTSPAGANAVILCGVLVSMVKAYPEFQPAEPLA
jgi:hypothetical protein